MASSGNFAVWNTRDRAYYVDITQGNLKLMGNSSTDAGGSNTTLGVSSGKWYVEFRVFKTTASYPYISLSSGPNAEDFHPNNGFQGEIRFHAPSSTRMNDNTSSMNSDLWGTVTLTETNTEACNNGDVVGFALDMDNKKLFISRNGTFFNSGDPANGTNPQATWTTNPPEVFFNCFSYTSSRGVVINAGQDSTFLGGVSAGTGVDDNGFGNFKYSVPSGFLALCSGNLPTNANIDPAGDDGATKHPALNFNAVAYTGNGGSLAVNCGFQPDLIWLKKRSSGSNQNDIMVDSTRGYNYAQSAVNTNNSFSYPGVSAITSTGVTLGGEANVNGSGVEHVGWFWKANGGSTSSNSNGDITSTVQANTDAGFSIVKWTSNNSSNQTIGHGLGAIPRFIISKPYSTGNWSWHVFHHYLGSVGDFQLNGYDTFTSGTNTYGAMPDANVFTVGSPGNLMPNNSTTDVISYCWANVDGMQKFGYYIGNNEDNNGCTVYTGFRPRLLFIKGATEAYGWYVFDSARSTSNLVDKQVSWYPGGAESVEPTGARKVDFFATGFKVMADAASINGATDYYIYGCWGDVPAQFNNAF